MISTAIEIEVEESNGKYIASIQLSPDSHRPVAEDPIIAIYGALVVSRGHIDDYIGFGR